MKSRNNSKIFVVLIAIFVLGLLIYTDTKAKDWVSEEQAAALICGDVALEHCLPKICKENGDCPVLEAARDRAVFDLLSYYEDPFLVTRLSTVPGKSIGSCILYQVMENSNSWKVQFFIRENCGSVIWENSNRKVEVSVKKGFLKIISFEPDRRFIADYDFCQSDNDCWCRHGSGMDFLGCVNWVYAPITLFGCYECDFCKCVSHQCVPVEGGYSGMFP